MTYHMSTAKPSPSASYIRLTAGSNVIGFYSVVIDNLGRVVASTGPYDICKRMCSAWRLGKCVEIHGEDYTIEAALNYSDKKRKD